jgi:transcriptional regulator with XRE-family HTH domain
MTANATAPVGGLRAERRAAGLSQERLAQLAGCSVSMVRLLESGYRPESSHVLDRIAAALSPNNSGSPGRHPGAPRTTSADQDGRHGTHGSG